MSTRRQNSRASCEGAALAAIAATVFAFSALPACAQGFFDSFFSRRQAPSAPAYANPGGDFFNPFGARPEPPRHEMGGSVAFCVRTCDGRYFPIQRMAGGNPAQQCSSFCPASETKIYNGSSIDHAAGPEGKKYSELSTAFVYREKIVPGCTCNGKDAFGVVNNTPVAEDPTLRPGDIVATNNGLMAYAGNGGGKPQAQFTPIDLQRGLSPELKQMLSEVKVDPAVPAPAPAQANPSSQNAPAVRNNRNKRVQAGR